MSGPTIKPLHDLYKEWFLDYASYVVLHRALPKEDGLKPVQRRILHSMKDMHDGRYHKVAGIIGHTMQYHPHGDASIGDALVHIGQKNLLIDMQGNWGDPRTGDGAAAPRYIEARLTPFALETLFSTAPTTTQPTYDGRKLEPLVLNTKFPLLLFQGTEGIAVGLSTKILPHNFQELLKASIAYLNDQPYLLLPDFPTGGIVDAKDYQKGAKGGKIHVRCTLRVVDKEHIHITSLPYGITTTTLIESILKANEKGKINIKKIEDNTAERVSIMITTKENARSMLNRLYLYTDAQISISPRACVIQEGRPRFSDVHSLLEASTRETQNILTKELQIEERSRLEAAFMLQLSDFFIRGKHYLIMESCKSWEAVLSALYAAMQPYEKKLPRKIEKKDILYLTELKMRRISRYDREKAHKKLEEIRARLAQIRDDLAHITRYTIDWYQNLLTKYGSGRERCTRIATFDLLEEKKVATREKTLYANLGQGFVGYELTEGKNLGSCGTWDDVIAFGRAGWFKVARVAPKLFMGDNLVHAARFEAGTTIYHILYDDNERSVLRAKKFQIKGITRGRLYDLIGGGNTLRYFGAHKVGEKVAVAIELSPQSRARHKKLIFDFDALAIKGRMAAGNIVTKYKVDRIKRIKTKP